MIYITEYYVYIPMTSIFLLVIRKIGKECQKCLQKFKNTLKMSKMH